MAFQDACRGFRKTGRVEDFLGNSESRMQKLVSEAKRVEGQAKRVLPKAEELTLAALKKVEKVETMGTQAMEELEGVNATIVAGPAQTAPNNLAQFGSRVGGQHERIPKARLFREDLDRAFQAFDPTWSTRVPRARNRRESLTWF
jgi:hypothetical protein